METPTCLDQNIPGSFHIKFDQNSCCIATDQYYVPAVYEPTTGEEDIHLCIASGIPVSATCKQSNDVTRELALCGTLLDDTTTEIDAEKGSILELSWFLSEKACMKKTNDRLANQGERYNPCGDTLAPTNAPTKRLTYPPGTLIPPPKDYTGEVLDEITSGLTRTHLVLFTLLGSFALLCLIAAFLFVCWYSCYRTVDDDKKKKKKKKKKPSKEDLYKEQWKKRKQRNASSRRPTDYASYASGSIYGRELP